jgi:hypothetical protein
MEEHGSRGRKLHAFETSKSDGRMWFSLYNIRHVHKVSCYSLVRKLDDRNKFPSLKSEQAPIFQVTIS